MSIHKLTILINDEYADEDTDPIASAVSNLEYDGYTIENWDIEFDIEEK